MAELTVNGVDITVSDNFLKMSPEAQDAFVKNTIVPSAEFKTAQQKGVKAEDAAPEKPGVMSELAKGIPLISPMETAREIGRTASEGLEKIEKRFTTPRGSEGSVGGLGTTGQALIGAGEVLTALPVGYARSVGGHLLTAAEMAGGRLLSAITGRDLTTQEDPAKMYEQARGDVDVASMAARPYGVPARMPILPGGPKIGPYETPGYNWQQPAARPPPLPPEPPKLTPLQQMAKEAGIEDALPRALTTDSWIAQQGAQVLSKSPMMGGRPIGEAIENVGPAIAARRGEIADQFGAQRLPENVGGDIRATLEGQAAAEATARKTAAQQAYENTKRGWEQSTQQREQQVADLEAQSARETARQVGPAPTTTGMGEHAIDAVRAEHDALRARKDALYADAGSRRGTIHDPAVQDIHNVVKTELRREGERGRVALGPDTTPRAMELNQAVKDFGLWAQNRRAAAEARAISEYSAARGYPEGYQIPPAERAAALQNVENTGVTLQQFEDFRKDLNAIYANINPRERPADLRAANRIMRGVDEFQTSAMGGRHYTGDPTALPAIQRARASNRELMQRFGYNDRFAEDKIIQKIIRDGPTDHIGPNDIADLLRAKPDKAGRVLDRIYEATGENPALTQSLRGGLYEHAARATEAGAPRTPEAIAKDLTRLTGGAREGLASRIYQPEDVALIRRHAEALRTGERARARTGEIAKATEPRLEVPEPGPAQQLAKDVIGSGLRGEEALLKRIEGFMSSKGTPADVKRLADVLKALPEDLKGNMLNLFVRRLGQAADGAFSPKQFADQWLDHIPSSVKHLLTGGASEHVKALDALANVSREYAVRQKRFGNPSGSGQFLTAVKGAGAAVAAMASGTLLAPMAMGAGWLGTAGWARFMAKPAGAASAAKFARQMAKFQAKPTVGQAAATKLAARNMRNTAIGLGVSVANFPEPAKK